MGTVFALVQHQQNRTGRVPRRVAYAEGPKRVPAREATSKPRTIVFAFDDSEGTKFAFEWALENFFRPTDNVLLLNVRAPPVLDRFGKTMLTSEEMAELDAAAMKKHHVIGELFALRLEENGIHHCELQLMHGSAPRAVCEVAKERQVDTIVMGTHGRGVMGRIIAGSVSTYVLHHSHCPVLVVRPPLDDIVQDSTDDVARVISNAITTALDNAIPSDA